MLIIQCEKFAIKMIHAIMQINQNNQPQDH